MKQMKLRINNIKNIKHAEVDIPLEKGVYAFVGSNGSGKSSILLALAQSVTLHALSLLRDEDFDQTSFVELEKNGDKDIWCVKKNKWVINTLPSQVRIEGMYEGSLFYGTRFRDSTIVDELVAQGKISSNDISNADEYVKSQLSYILHGDYSYYQKLKRIKRTSIAFSLGLKNLPYFNICNDKLISQYRMSSGECMLISLLHFINNAIIRRSLPKEKTILMLIDEIELALHPIAVSRLLDLLNDLVENSESLVVILTTHSPEVIRKIPPNMLHLVENTNGIISINTPCYPSYVIRDVYKHDGFDYLLLVEDFLAKCVVEKILFQDHLTISKLVHVVPAGGWSNVLKLQKELLENNVIGVGREIISILDGDIQHLVGTEFDTLKKLFLPIQSVEKFIYNVLIENPNIKIKKLLNDKYFAIDSLESLISDFNKRYPVTYKEPDKKLYFVLKKNLEKRKISEEIFISRFCEDIMNEVDFTSFRKALKKVLT